MGCGTSSLKGDTPADLSSSNIHPTSSSYKDQGPAQPPSAPTSVTTEPTVQKPSGRDSIQPRKKGLYERYTDARMGRNVHYTDEELKKHTGMDNKELKLWANSAPGVGKNQISGQAMVQTQEPVGQVLGGGEGDKKKVGKGMKMMTELANSLVSANR